MTQGAGANENQAANAAKPPTGTIRPAPAKQTFKVNVAAGAVEQGGIPAGAGHARRPSFPAAPTSPRLSQVRRVSAPPPARRDDPWRKETAWCISGCIVYLLFLAAWAFYFYVRIRYTLTGGLFPYAVVILVFEFISASSMVVHGLSLLRRRVPRKIDPASPPPPREYIIRVLIPCYTESLQIVREVATAAADAMLPDKCKRTVYLLDDGKDAEKAAWVAEQGREDLIYRSGRVRAPGETNGKACNLNNTLRWLYPAEKNVADEELIVVFDADMVCNSEFFVKMIAELYDPQVALVLTPQAFHNYDPSCDIFNHSNLIYWAISLPGIDGWDNVSCTGTNFVVRARAAQEAGFFPTYTLGEDMALALEIQKAGWKGAYVNEYMATGEVPETVRNAFMQKSRWCKGGMQIFFSKHNALLAKNISFMQKIIWNTSGLAYLSTTVTTPVFLVVPVVGVWAGYFPLEFSRWFALAFTLYAVASHALLYYCHDLKHIRSIYFSICAAHVFWFAYAKACVNTMTAALLHREIKFKTTEKTVMAATVTDAANKARNKLRNTYGHKMWMEIQDLWIHVIVFIFSLATAVVGIIRLAKEANFKQIQTISILVSVGWTIYNLMAPMLLIWHKLFKTRGLVYLVNLCATLSSVIVGVIVILIWLILPQEYDYNVVLGKSLDFYEAQRSGLLPANNTIDWRGDSALSDVGPGGGSLVGGYYNDAGAIKYGFPLASTITILAWSMLEFGKGYSHGQLTQRGYDTIRWGTDYMLKCNGNNFGAQFSYVAQVGDFSDDRAYWGKPEQMIMPRPVGSVTRSNPGSDLLGGTAAALAASAMVFAPTDPTYAATLTNTAIELFSEGAGNLGYYSRSVRDAGILYNSTSYFDDLAWGAIWLYRRTGDAAYLAAAQQYHAAQLPYVPLNDPGRGRVFNWDNVMPGVSYMLAEVAGFRNSSYNNLVDNFVHSWAHNTDGISKTPKYASWVSPNGPLSETANAGLIAWLWSTNSGATGFYKCWAEFQMRYILGDGHQSYVIGHGNNPPLRPQHKGASCSGGPNNTCPTGADISSRPNPHVLTGALVNGPQRPDDSYDDIRTLDNSKVALQYNAGFTAMLAALAQQGKGTFTHCSQSHGFIYTLHSNSPV